MKDPHFNSTPTRAAPNQQLLSPVSWALVHLQAHRKTYGFITGNFFIGKFSDFGDLGQQLHCSLKRHSTETSVKSQVDMAGANTLIANQKHKSTEDSKLVRRRMVALLKSGDTARLKQKYCGRARAWPLAVALALPGSKSGSWARPVQIAKHSKAPAWPQPSV